MRILVGTYGESDSVWQLRLDPEQGEVISCGAAGAGRRCSYLALSRGLCYAVSETPLSEGSSGALYSYRITREGLEKADTREGMPCILPHLSVNRAGTALYTVSYGTGEVLAVRLLPDGGFGGILSRAVHTGRGPHPTRQTSAHPHSIWLDGGERFAYMCDLGTDEILSWPLRPDGSLELSRERSLKLPGGYGVRHMAFSPDGTRCYALCEMAYRLLVLKVREGVLTLERDIPAAEHIPPEEQGGAAILLSPDGKTLWCSNRGRRHSQINAFSLEDPAFPTALGEPLTQCQWPRDLCLSPDGQFLLCANQTENSLSLFRRDPGAGRFLLHRRIPVPSPACLLPLPEEI